MRTLIILLLLSSMASCQSSRKTAVGNISENRKIELEKLSTRKVDILPSNVSMKIPAINGVINETPPGSSYNARKGNASVSVRFIRDTLFVEANCDSLSQIIWEYERKIGEMQNSEITDKTESKIKSFGIQKYFLASAFIIAIIMLLRYKGIFRKP